MREAVMTGIYCIENLKNGKKYIGSSVDIKTRWSSHRSSLEKQCHRNSYLQRSWNKYGKEMFSFYLIEECSSDILDQREFYWITSLKTMNGKFGYNLLFQYNNRVVMTEEVRKKKSDSAKKQWKQIREKMISGLKDSWKDKGIRHLGAVTSGKTRRDTRKVVASDLSGNILATYCDRREAFLQNGKLRNIYKVLSREKDHCNGVIYRYY